MKLPNDLIQDWNNARFPLGQHPVGLGDVLQYLCDSLGDNEQIVVPADEATQGVQRAVPTAYAPGLISKDAEYVHRALSAVIMMLQKQIQKEQDICTHNDILKALLALDARVSKLENP